MAAEKEEVMDDSSASSDHDSEEDDLESELHAKLKALDERLSANAYDYQAHVDKVDVLKSQGELDLLRVARESFAALYPLAPDLWLAWLRDEQGLATSADEKEAVFNLFERAVKDYVAPEVWLEYCQFSLCGLGSAEGVQRARDIFERAVAAVGINVAKGALIWEAFREFETALLSLMDNSENHSDKEKDEQKAKIDKLFRRQLTVPLLDMDSTLEEYRDWLSGGFVDQCVTASFRSARKMLEEREDLENRLLQTSEDAERRRSAYDAYLKVELNCGNPARVQCLYERMVTDQCLETRVWSEYLNYLKREIKIDEVLLKVHERSVRNCPWSADLWISYLQTLESLSRPQTDVVRLFEQALEVGSFDEGPSGFLNIWLAFIDYKRRSLDLDDEKSQEVLREIFVRALNHLTSVGADPDCRVARYWATLEGDHFKAMDEARRIWADVLAATDARADLCLENLQLEKMCGDTKHLRKLFPRLLDKCQDWPEKVGEAWVQFEREEGSLPQFLEAKEKVQSRVAKAKEVREQQAEAKKDKMKARKVKKTTYAEQKRDGAKRKVEEPELKREGTKRKAEEPDQKGDEDSAFKVPLPPPVEKKAKIEPPPGYVPEKADDADRNSRTVFISNLDYAVGESELRSMLESSGEISELRLVKTPAGKSKGFAYVEFTSRSSVDAALARDRELLGGRPVFISEKTDNPSSRPHAFKYETALEKNKIFVRHLPPSHATSEEMEKLFGNFGCIKSVRLPTYRNGHSKGIAFVEFEEEKSANAAVTMTDGTVLGGKEISVAISNPPPRKTATPTSAVSLGSGSRKEGRLQQGLFVPRALQVRPASATKATAAKDANKNGAEKEQPKTNQQFRNMLLGT